ncbi:MAG: hypothetical protein EOP53_11040 [Sphingobacteriales bacterium]|nr:MAG: hypothetical protein EOP53_11040 [Sphingobacteriales bacterium]
MGAVSRGCNEVSTGIPADTLIIGEGSFPLYWSSTYTKSILAIYDVAVDGAAIQKSILKDKVPINFDSITKSLPPGDYYWNITDEEGNGCERSFLRLLDSATYEQNVYMLIENIPNTTMAEIAFARSFILQQHFYIAPALASSKLAAELEPSNKLYKKNLAQFYATQF